MRKCRTESLFPQMDSAAGLEDRRFAGGHIVRLAFACAADSEFDYLVPDDLWPVAVGQRLQAPLGKLDKPEVGFCTRTDVPPQESFLALGRGRRLKAITGVVDKEPLLVPQLMDLARWISEYYVCPLGQVLAAMVPAAVKKAAGLKTQRHLYLAEPAEDRLRGLRGRRQKQVVALLAEKRAFCERSAVQLEQVLSVIGCGPEPVRRLLDKGIIVVTQRTVTTALPVIPPGMAGTCRQVVLNEDQQKALAHVRARIEAGGFGVTLLHGVTDSGKTELYIRAIESALAAGKRAIVLLPEIALTAQTVQRFSARFQRIAVMHSALTAAQRNAQWQKIRAGVADVVIGARSAVFCPLTEVGLIVVDEEHEPSYKQDTAPRYNGRDVAIKRAQLAGAHCILGSATPSLETLMNCRRRQHFSIVRLPKRVMDLPMPRMVPVDMRTQEHLSLISEPLGQRLAEVLARGEQAILLLNRRGYSNFVFCPSCKHTLHCRNCDVTLTFHRSRAQRTVRMQTITGRHIGSGYAVCHYCLAKTLVPSACPVCGKKMAMIGLGSQRLEEELAAKFPGARVARIDSDSMAGKDYYRLLADFSQGRIDILAGTQMLAKGLHFPNVTLVGIISADTCLCVPDFRANERTFQLISQVAGRAGRSRKAGVVFVQTFLPEQPAIRFALAGDFEGFVAEELKHRKACNLPPYWRLAVIGVKDMNFEKLERACSVMAQRVEKIIAANGLEVVVRGPMPAAISRLKRFHRMQIIVQAPDASTMQRLFAELRAAGPVRPAVKIAVDVDPVNLL